MTKARFSISVDVVYADRIKAAAAQAGVDVSAYMWRAALDAVERDERAVDVFVELDAHIHEAEADDAEWPPPPLDGELTDEEQAAISARWDAFFNAPVRGVA